MTEESRFSQAQPEQPMLTRFEIGPSGRVRYAISGYGHQIEGTADQGTTSLFVLIQFLADYGPKNIETLPETLQGSPALDALFATIQQREWSATLSCVNYSGSLKPDYKYKADLHLPYRYQTQPGIFRGEGVTAYAALRMAYEAAVASPDDEATQARREEHRLELLQR